MFSDPWRKISRSTENLSTFTSHTGPVLRRLNALLTPGTFSTGAWPTVIGMAHLLQVLKRDYGWARQCMVVGQDAHLYGAALGVAGHPGVYAVAAASSQLLVLEETLAADPAWEYLENGVWTHGTTRLLRVKATTNLEAYPLDSDTIVSVDFGAEEPHFAMVDGLLPLLTAHSCLLISSKPLGFWTGRGFTGVCLRDICLPTPVAAKARMYIICIHKHRSFDTVLGTLNSSCGSDVVQH